MKIAIVASEMVPFAKTGGLADVVGALPKYLPGADTECCCFIPFYKKIRRDAYGITDTGLRIEVPLDSAKKTAGVFRAMLPGTKVPVYLIDNEEFFGRDELYGTPAGDYPDNSARFIFFSRAVLEAAHKLNIKPDVFHVHDWQAALIPVYLKTLYANRFGKPAVVLTIHNLAYQGVFWHWDMKLTGLGWDLFNWRQLEFYGKLNFLKAGIVFSDVINTVSPTYAREIQTPEYGSGLEEVLRYRSASLHGIINGIDYDVWDPKTDPLIHCKYGTNSLNNKGRNKAELQRMLGLPGEKKVPVIGMISRLAAQKGLDIISGAMDELVKRDVQLVFLGTGEQQYHDMLADFQRKFPSKVSVSVKFDNALAHLIEAGSDMFLMPSRYEPCGLNQLYSLKYGTVPIVRHTGGLADSVIDATHHSIEEAKGTGFVFSEYSSKALLATVDRALVSYGNRTTWRRIMESGMQQDWSWANSAKEYLKLFEQAKGGK
ncbi:MAG: glycogen synthase GlgA [Candidatus Brocadiia bacterium]